MVNRWLTTIKVLLIVAVVFLYHRSVRIARAEVSNNPVAIDWGQSYQSSLDSLNQLYQKYLSIQDVKLKTTISKIKESGLANSEEVITWIEELQNKHEEIVQREIDIANNPVFPTLTLDGSSLLFLPFPMGYQSFTSEYFTEKAYMVWRLDLHQLETYINLSEDYSALFRHSMPLDSIINNVVEHINESLVNKNGIKTKILNELIIDEVKSLIADLQNDYKRQKTTGLKFNNFNKKSGAIVCPKSSGLQYCKIESSDAYILGVELSKEAHCELQSQFGISLDTRSVWADGCSGTFDIIYQNEPIVFPAITNNHKLYKTFGTRGFLDKKLSAKRMQVYFETENYLDDYVKGDLTFIEKFKDSILSNLNKIKYRHSLSLQVRLKLYNEEKYELYNNKLDEIKIINIALYNIIKRLQSSVFAIDRIRNKTYSISYVKHTSIDYYASLLEAVIGFDTKKITLIDNEILGRLSAILDQLNNYQACDIATWGESCAFADAKVSLDLFEGQFRNLIVKQLNGITFYQSTSIPATEGHYSWPSINRANEVQLDWVEVTE